MQTISLNHRRNVSILALGAESAGNFSVFRDGRIFSSDDFGDLLEEANWIKYQASVLKYLKDNKIKPQIILTDLHPLYKTTLWGEELAKKSSAKFVQVQHHHAHIFSAVGDKILHNTSYLLPPTFYCIAMDGTGFGVDEKIWGGEAFKVESRKNKVASVKRIGHLENQVMVSGDLAVREPARMLIGVLSKLLSNKEIYPFIKKYYTKNEFELIYNQLQQNFNCLETSSTGRVLDAISLLLGFCGNVRKYKHEPIDKLEKNSDTPYSDLKPKIIFDKKEKKYILLTTPLFKYLIKNINKDKKRLATTAQIYIAEGLYEIIKLKCYNNAGSIVPIEPQSSDKLKFKNSNKILPEIKGLGKMPEPAYAQYDNIFISGGIANNKIISNYFISKGAYASKIIPRGDAGLSFGQIVYYLLGK
ncbi:MAG: hypothetical protein WC678_01020 [Parcubacteria group bacterium]|jgi:hydrogenase maturation protein HypF